MVNIENEIFLTGGTGIAGSFAIPEFIQRNHHLRVVTRKLLNASKIPLLNYVQGDLAKIDDFEKISRTNAGIIHYACASLRNRADPEIDIEAMKILLKNWEKGPFTFISTIDVYGAPQNTDSIDETHILSGRMNSYASGKIACEELLIENAKLRGRNDFSILRAPWIFAPTIASKNHIQNRFLKDFVTEITLPGTTKEEWEKRIDFWVDARDLAWLVAEAFVNPLGGAGNVIGGQFNWHELFSILKTVANINIPIIHKKDNELNSYAIELFGQQCFYSGELVNKHFQFKPRYNLRETLQEAFSHSENSASCVAFTGEACWHLNQDTFR
jgi:nucleoside-diphosphate-sugar epimerase